MKTRRVSCIYFTNTFQHLSENFIDFDDKFQTLIFSEYYKKKVINIQIFTFYSLIIEWLQNGYKSILCSFNKNVSTRSFDIAEEKRYNTKHQSETALIRSLVLLKKRNQSGADRRLSGGIYR